MNAWDDPRIARGMQKQLADRRARIAAGEKPIGWKVGLGAKPAMERLGITMPAVGYMMEKSVVPDGGTVSVAGWKQPVAEPEIAVYMATDLASGAGRDATIAAIGALGPAIELADLAAPPTDVEVVLAGNIFHRNVILGTARQGARRREARRPCGPDLPPRRASRAAGGPATEHRQHRRYRGACGRHARRQRRKAARRRRDHHRLDRPTAHDRAGRDRIRLSARADGPAFGAV